MSSPEVANLAAKAPEGAQQKTLFWLGIKDPSRLKMEGLPECPFQCIHVGGQDFPLVTEDVRKTPGGNATTRTQIFGALRHLDRHEVQAVKARMKKKVIRGRRMLTTESAHYRPQPGDVPVEKFLYIREVQAHEIIAHRPIPPVPPEAIKSEELASQDALDATRKQVHQQLKMTGQKLPL